MTPTAFDATRGISPPTPLAKPSPALLVSTLWFSGAFLYLLIMFFTARQQIDPMVMFAVGQSGILSGALAAGMALATRRRGAALLFGVGTLLLAALLFAYFPMGVAECQEWVQRNVGVGRP